MLRNGVFRGKSVSYWNTKEYKKALKLDANIVILQFGTNDASAVNWDVDKFESDYLDLINTFQKLPLRPKIFVCIPPPIYRPQIDGTLVDVVNGELSKRIQSISEKTKDIEIIDLYLALGGAKLNKPELFLDYSKPFVWPNDGCHPNDQGQEVISRTVLRSILKNRFW